MKRTFSVTSLALLLAALTLCCACVPAAVTPEKKHENSVTYYYTGADTSTRFFCNNDLLEDKLGGEVDAFLTCDGTVAIARVGTGLYRIDKDGLLMVHPAGVSRALLSQDGSKIVFSTATEVHIYDHTTGELEDVKPEDVTSVLSIVLSPDGKTVGYTVRSKQGELVAYAHENGSSRRLSSNAYIIGVGDEAAFWYYLTPEADFYYSTASSKKKLGEQAANIFEFNRDLTEVTFDMNGVTYFSRDGKSAKRIVEGASVLTTAGACSSTQGGDDCTAYVKDCDTLLGTVFYDYHNGTNDEGSRTIYNLWYVDAYGKAKELVKGAFQFGLSSDASMLTCLVDSDLYIMPVDSPGKAQKITSNVYSYLSVDDAEMIYCIGYDLTLYRIKNLKAIESVLDGAVYCVLTDGGSCLCLADFDETGTLYCVDRQGEAKKVGSKVYMVETDPKFCRYYSAPYKNDAGNDVYDLYTSLDGASFELALEGVKLYTD